MNNTTNNSPQPEPRKKLGDRWIKATWPVGEPNAEGWQAYTDLHVNYNKHRGYHAALNVHHEQKTAKGVTHTINLSPNRTEAEIHSRPATRFSRKILAEFYDTAVHEVRQLFASGDETVTRYFDPDSAVYSYAGAPDRP
ncbi:hypothetical protein [Nocardia carnea]|uniref:hypothetical protein n=1 Tax=Nocardia carnea TaxID=37328 RepID=UPI000316B105|nr:hypothetical protein [Nocardia carnea]